MNFIDKIKNITKDSCLKTMFLTQTEQAMIRNQLKHVDFVLDGGYSGAELKRAYINLPNDGVTCFNITYNKQFLTLTHQNILGSILSLKINKEAVGDILPDQNAFFVIKELEGFIINEFKEIGNHPITLEVIDGTHLIKHNAFEEFVCYIDSLRLDLVISRITRKSRNESLLMIENDLIKVNHLIINKHTKTIQENDIISIRKFGRYKILNTQNTSKKGKIVLKYAKYI